MELDQLSTNKKLTTTVRSCMLGILTSGLLVLASGISTALADDTEIFTAEIPQPPESSNVVFLIDTSGSMWNMMPNDENNRRKIHAVQNVFENLIFDMANTGDHSAVNPAMQGRKIALMRFDDGDSNGGYFLTPMQTLNEGTMDQQNGNGNGFWPQIQNLVQFDADDNRTSPQGYTPLAEAAYEAARFFRGETPVYGNRLPPANDPNSSNRTSPGINHPNVTLGNGNYKSPFREDNGDSQCGVNNHLVILTDGLPTQDNSADIAINALDNTDDCVFNEANNTDCLPQVAKHLYETDLIGDLDGFQNVKTHTIAFDLSGNNTALELLRTTARLGGNGAALVADSEAQLHQAILDVFTAIQDSAMSFVNPAVTVSSSNRFAHDNSVYMGLFKPQLSPWWYGNLKGYQYDSNAVLKDFSTDDPETAAAVFNDSGAFRSTAISKWSGSTADGGNIEQGGAAQQILAQSERRIFTQNSSTPSSPDLVRFRTEDAGNIPPADLGITNPDADEASSQREALIQWATSRSELPIGDPLHSEPKIINYGGDSDTGIGPVIFFGTNHGFLHAISARTGQELMAFIPKSLLANLRTIRDNNSQNDHPYGLDGYISYHVKDNGDGTINAADGDKVLIVFGMRRGGNELFALDVTNLNQPRQQWHIRGGEGDYPDLGNTWSRPIITKMNFGNVTDEPKVVALIGGGYDNQYDELVNEISNPAGAALYAIDLYSNDGNCLWSASDSASADSNCENHTQISSMTHSIPSHISAIDLMSNGPGVVDRLYAIDIIGQIFRIDLNFTDSNGNYIFSDKGKKLADLSGGTRRYYYGVDVAYTDSAFSSKLHLSVGSGHRAHPLATGSGDVIVSFFDTHVFDQLPTDYTAVSFDSLTNLTDPATPIPADSNGWYITLNNAGRPGEKVLAPATSTAGYVFLTTYTPPNGTLQPGTCEVSYGQGTVYAMSLLDASPMDGNNRAISINTNGIPSAVGFLTLNQPEGDGDGTTTDNPLASLDTKVFPIVSGLKVELPQVAQEKLNTSLEATKSYWYIGEPEEETATP